MYEKDDLYTKTITLQQRIEESLVFIKIISRNISHMPLSTTKMIYFLKVEFDISTVS